MNDIWKDIRKELSKFNTTYEFLNNIGETIKQYPNFNLDCLSKGQLYSKLWVIKELQKLNIHLGTIHIYCGWYAILVNMLISNFEVDRIRSFDIDPECEKIADEININHVINKWKFKAYTKNVNSLIIRTDADTIINLSCEHLADNSWFDILIPKKLVILQSNNFIEIDDHINCVENINDMIIKYPLEQIYFAGELKLIDYKRFMLIGKK